MFGLTADKILIIVVIAVFLLGPERVPMYASKLAQLVKNVRNMARDAKSRMRDEMGEDFDDIDWQKLDPRQYDPRRIIREAWGDTDIDELLPSKEALSVAAGGAAAGAAAKSTKSSGKGRSAKDEGPQRAPFDDEAT